MRSRTKPEPLLDVEAVSDWLGIPITSLYAQRTRNEPPGSLGIKVGRHIRFSRSVVEEWLESRLEGR